MGTPFKLSRSPGTNSISRSSGVIQGQGGGLNYGRSLNGRVGFGPPDQPPTSQAYRPPATTRPGGITGPRSAAPSISNYRPGGYGARNLQLNRAAYQRGAQLAHQRAQTRALSQALTRQPRGFGTSAITSKPSGTALARTPAGLSRVPIRAGARLGRTAVGRAVPAVARVAGPLAAIVSAGFLGWGIGNALRRELVRAGYDLYRYPGEVMPWEIAAPRLPSVAPGIAPPIGGGFERWYLVTVQIVSRDGVETRTIESFGPVEGMSYEVTRVGSPGASWRFFGIVWLHVPLYKASWGQTREGPVSLGNHYDAVPSIIDISPVAGEPDPPTSPNADYPLRLPRPPFLVPTSAPGHVTAPAPAPAPATQPGSAPAVPPGAIPAPAPAPAPATAPFPAAQPGSAPAAQPGSIPTTLPQIAPRRRTQIASIPIPANAIDPSSPPVPAPVAPPVQTPPPTNCQQMRDCLAPIFNGSNNGSNGSEVDVCAEDCIQELLALTRELHDSLFSITSFNMLLEQCAQSENGSPQYDIFPVSGRRIELIEDGFRTLAELLSIVGKRICDISPIAAIPEWWAVRPGADRPQLVVLLKAKDSYDYWSFSIPHYARGEDTIPSIPEFTKGSHFAILTLRDNSKIWINAASTDMAESVVRAIAAYIDGSQLPSPLKIHTGERKGEGLRQVEVKPIRGLFYSTGQRNQQPDWEIRFDQEENDGDR